MAGRYRNPSPRRFADPMRSSTGMLYNTTSLDIPHHSSARASVGDIHPARGSVSRAPEAQLISSVTYRGDPTHGGPPISKSEYKIPPIRQRRNTLDPESARQDPSRQPLNIAIPVSPNRSRPIVSASDRPRSPLPKSYREEPAPYLVPASSTSGRNHRRITSADGENVANLAVHDRERRARADRQYPARARDQRAYPMGQQVARYREPDYQENYSYTTPREEFDIDSAAKSAARVHPRRGSHDRRERPQSIVGLEGYLPPRNVRDRDRDRDAGPPVSYRPPPARGGRADDDIDLGRRYSVRDPVTREKDEAYDSPKRKPLQRAPVALHQDRDRERDEGYTPYREDYDDKRDRHHRHSRHDDDSKDPGQYDHDPRRNHKREEEGGHGAVLGAVGAAGLATAAIASSRHKDRDRGYEEEEASRRERKDRDRDRERRNRDVDPRDEDRADERKPRDRRLDILSDDDGKPRSKDLVDSSSETSDRDHGKHRRRRKHRKEGKKDDESSSSSSDSRPADPLVRDPDREERHRRREERDRHGFIPDEDERGPLIQESISDAADAPRAKRVEIVPLVPLKESEVPVKSILKKRTIPFPEDPNAIREGVAPLKDAGKTGVPPGARWTKIDRRLVNPAALEAAHERFEDRPDYVIVLRVLTKEEIQKFAEKTQEIRDERYEAEKEERRRRRHEKDDRKRDRRQTRPDESSSSSSDDEYERKKEPLQLEAPPPQGDPRLVDPRFGNPDLVRQQQQQQQQKQPVPVPVQDPRDPRFNPELATRQAQAPGPGSGAVPRFNPELARQAPPQQEHSSPQSQMQYASMSLPNQNI